MDYRIKGMMPVDEHTGWRKGIEHSDRSLTTESQFLTC